jgi:hydrogenase maturation factor HypF (carbamoyltransferase family)
LAALAGFMHETTFEGQAAIWLEHQARRCRQAPYEFANLDPRALLQAGLGPTASK